MADATTELTAESDQQIAPDNSKPMTERQGADSIAALLDADPTILDPGEDDKKTKESAPKPDEEEDPLGDDEDVETKDEDADQDGSPDTKATAGKYVSPQAKYKLADGSEITVGELARNNLFQRDYSVKTEEVSRERAAITKEKTEVAQLSKTLTEERQYLIWFAEKYAPKAPERPALSAMEDPVGHMNYRAQMDEYQAFAEHYRQFKTAADGDVERQKGETQKQANDRAAREVQSLFQKVKIDPRSPKASQFFEAIEKGGKEFFGLTADEIAAAAKQDHRYILILRTAIRAMQNKKSVPDVQEKLKAAPKMLRAPTARQTGDARQNQAKSASKEKLRQTGSFNDGVAAIEALLS